MITFDPHPSRRHFLRRTALGGALLLATSAPRSSRGAADEPIEVGFMGLNARGGELLADFLATGRITASWLCDVDERAIERAGRTVRERQTRPFKTTRDFRQILDDRRVRALVIAAPDHWHVPAALLALRAAKAVYLETPLGHNPREGELLVEALRRHRGLVHVGHQYRSLPWVGAALGRVRGGDLGTVTFARAWSTRPPTGIGIGQLAPVPAWLDYDLWQGPAPERVYRDNVIHDHWNRFWHWGTGEIGHAGVHWLDLARWGLQVDAPVRVAAAGGRYHFDDDQETPDTQVVTYDFGDRTLVWEHRGGPAVGIDGEPAGVAFFGTRGTLILGSTSARFLDASGKETERVTGENSTAPHVAAFLDQLARKAPASTAAVEDAGQSALLCHLGNISQRLGRSLRINPRTRQLQDDAEASRFWRREYRTGWEPNA